ncbi:hypothetical protein GGR53DRAFT_396314 [Hypoxylon sp. FL1150]|nr:hypothetical protein GGR53DRAFT_396314 [Hypoxylon sp. FL1150]
MCSADLFLGLLAILFPPLPVWVKCGLCSADSIINILLCMLGYIPGLLHSWYIISKFPESYEYEEIPQDGERGSHGNNRVTYVFVRQPEREPQPKPTSPTHPNYGGMGHGNSNNAAGSSSSAGPASDGHDEGRAPPTYAEAVKGDHKVQTHD